MAQDFQSAPRNPPASARPGGDFNPRDEIHDRSEPAERDTTREQIHELSQPAPHDATREQVRNMKDWSLSEAVGLPLLSTDTPSKDAAGKRDNAAPTSGPAASNEPPYRYRANQGPFAAFSRNDRYAIYAAAAMTLLPLLGADIFSR